MSKHMVLIFALIIALPLCACGHSPVKEAPPSLSEAEYSPVLPAATLDTLKSEDSVGYYNEAEIYAYCEKLLEALLDNDVTTATLWLMNITDGAMPEIVLSVNPEKSGGEAFLQVHTWIEDGYALLPLPKGKTLPEALGHTILPYREKETGDVIYIAIGGMHHNSCESQEYIALKNVEGRLTALPLFAEETQCSFAGEGQADNITHSYTVANVAANKQEYEKAFQSFFNNHDALSITLPKEEFFKWEALEWQEEALTFVIESYFQLQAVDTTQLDAAYRHLLTWYYEDYGVILEFVLADLDFDTEQEIVLFTDPGGTGGETYISVRKWEGADFEKIALPPSLFGDAAFGDTLECYKNKETSEEMFVTVGGMQHAYFGSEEWIGFAQKDGRFNGTLLFSKKYEWEEATNNNTDTTYFVAGQEADMMEYEAARADYFESWEKTDYDWKPVRIFKYDSNQYKVVLEQIYPMLVTAFGGATNE